jgi:23S rRNA (adenine2503-C2)-methyltransferase
MQKLTDIRSLSIIDLEEFLELNGEKKFRAKQVYEWLWSKSVRNFDSMTNLSLPLRTLLQSNFSFKTVAIADSQISKDRTIKNAFKCYDGNVVEGVYTQTKKVEVNDANPIKLTWRTISDITEAE